MAKLPSYNTKGWGSDLNNYLVQLHKRLQTCESILHSSDMGEGSLSLMTKYASSGVTNDNFKFYKTTSLLNLTSEDPFKDQSLLTKICEFAPNTETSKTYIYATGSVYFAATMSRSTAALKNITIELSTIIQQQYDTTSSVPAAVGIRLDKDNEPEILLLRSVNVKKDKDGNVLNTGMNSYTSFDIFIVGWVSYINEKFYFLPSPSLAPNSFGMRQEYLMNPKGAFSSDKDWYITTEGISYPSLCEEITDINTASISLYNDYSIYHYVSSENPKKLLYTRTIDTASNSITFYLRAIEENDLNEDDLLKDIAYDSENKIKYIIVKYLTRFGFIVYYRETIDKFPNTTNEMKWIGISGEFFQEFLGYGLVEISRRTYESNGENPPIRWLTFSTGGGGISPSRVPYNLVMSNNEFNWNTVGILSTETKIEGSSDITSGMHIVPRYANTSSKVMLNTIACSNTDSEKDIPRIMLYNTKITENIVLKKPDDSSILFSIKIDDDSLETNFNNLSITNDNIILGKDNMKYILLTANKISMSKDVSIGGTLTFTSDVRYKTNIQQFTSNALKIINKLPIITYEFKNNLNHRYLGTIAQEVEKYCPEIIETVDDSENGIADKKLLEEHKLVFLCIKAIQELSKELETLKNKE